MVIPLEDSKIVELFLERSEDAIEALSEKYGSLCMKIAGNILNNRQDAEECVNDTYLGVWNAIPPHRPNILVSFVYRITRNLAIAKFHREQAAKRNSSYDLALDELENCFASRETVEEAFQAKLVAESIDRFLLAQPQQSRVLFVRRYYYADSVGELALRFGISSHTVSVRLSRIREKLRKHLIREGVSI